MEIKMEYSDAEVRQIVSDYAASYIGSIADDMDVELKSPLYNGVALQVTFRSKAAE